MQVIDNGYVKLIETWGSDERFIEAARMSTGGGFRGWDNDERLLSYLYKNKHSTPFEMGGMVIEVKAPIFVFREWMRHRSQSFNEMSARYIPIPDENYLPTLERVLDGANTKTANKQAQGSGKELSEQESLDWLVQLGELYDHAQNVYQWGLDGGIPKELARLAMPVARYSKMRASANLRNWLGFLTLRKAPNAQWEIRQYADAVGKLVEQNFPRTYKLFIEEFKTCNTQSKK